MGRVFVPDEPLIANTIRFDVVNADQIPGEYNVEFMLDEALRQAKIDLDLYRDAPELKPQGSEALLSNINLLVHMRVRGTGGALNAVSEATRRDELRTALSPVLRVPLITIDRLGG